MPGLISPPGKFSQRTDKDPKIVEPDLDRPDMQYGDRQELVNAQRIAKKNIVRAPALGARRMTGEPNTGSRIPPWLMQTPSARPFELVTAGLDVGAGPGSEALTAATPSEDIRVAALSYFRDTYGNQDAAEMLHSLQEKRAERPAPSPPGPGSPPAGSARAPAQLESPIAPEPEVPEATAV